MKIIKDVEGNIIGERLDDMNDVNKVSFNVVNNMFNKALIILAGLSVLMVLLLGVMVGSVK